MIDERLEKKALSMFCDMIDKRLENKAVSIFCEMKRQLKAIVLSNVLCMHTRCPSIFLHWCLLDYWC